MVVYQNAAQEPDHAQRQITFQVIDGLFTSNLLEGVISINLTNDNPLVLMCPTAGAHFTEDIQVSVNITQGLSLSDQDNNHAVTGARIEVSNAQNGDIIAIMPPSSSSLSLNLMSATLIQINGTTTTVEYQVCSEIWKLVEHCTLFLSLFYHLHTHTHAHTYIPTYIHTYIHTHTQQEILRTITFTNVASEPSSKPRQISLSVTDNGGSNSSCIVMVDVVLINDNVPVVDLSGVAGPTINYTTTVGYAVPPQQVSIASPTAHLIDNDSNGVITMVNITLSQGQQEDQLVFHPMCFITTLPTNCFLRFIAMFIKVDVHIFLVHKCTLVYTHRHHSSFIIPLLFLQYSYGYVYELYLWKYSAC